MHAVYVARTPLALFEYHLPIQKSYKSREYSHSHNIDLGFDMLAVESCHTRKHLNVTMFCTRKMLSRLVQVCWLHRKRSKNIQSCWHIGTFLQSEFTHPVTTTRVVVEPTTTSTPYHSQTYRLWRHSHWTRWDSNSKRLSFEACVSKYHQHAQTTTRPRGSMQNCTANTCPTSAWARRTDTLHFLNVNKYSRVKTHITTHEAIDSSKFGYKSSALGMSQRCTG